QEMQVAVRNVGRPGPTSMAMAAADLALWDLKARLLELPLVQLLGQVHDEVAVYGSGGFTSLTDDELAAQLVGWVGGQGIPRVQVTADVTAGEYGFDLWYFERMCAAGAVDCLQVDVTRCGGVTTWMQAAAVAAGHGLEVSGHCAPALHLHVACATTNVRHLEY